MATLPRVAPANMSTATFPPLRTFTDWIVQTDDHAERRLALLDEAERILAGREPASIEAKRSLAARLERWRYQMLNERHSALGEPDRQLAHALDLAANRLAGRAPRPPRWPRGAILETPPDDPTLAEVKKALDPATRLEELAVRAAELTRQHFTVQRNGIAVRRMFMYAPLYLSNLCINHCLYCGFRHPNPIERVHLGIEEAVREAVVLLARGFRHILLVAGDYPSMTSTEYYAAVIDALCQKGVVPSVEIAPQSTEAYEALRAAGAHGVTLYQETYDPGLYARYHPRGPKVSFDWRLEGIERAAEAGMKRLGLGVLLGLGPPLEELLALVRHGCYLAARFPACALAFSLPRIHEAPQGFVPPFSVDDETFVRMYCALRLAFPQAELVLSTREMPELRGRLARICITQMSAGSSTAPGGYHEQTCGTPGGEQFPVADHRSVPEVLEWLESAGICPVWDPSAA